MSTRPLDGSDQDNNTPGRKRRRVRAPAWKDRPAFLDASTSISASTFGARRLVELRQLYDAVNTGPLQAEDAAFQSGGGKTSSRHLRRRTTSHNTRRHLHRFPAGIPETNKPKSTTRKAKRSSSTMLCQGHHEWQQQQQQQQQEDLSTNTEDSTSSMDVNTTSKKGPRFHWMMTHLWHAKRFHMQSLWGWRIPVAHTNRGARAVLRLSTEKRKGSLPPHCTLQDLTFCRQALSIESIRDCTLKQFLQTAARILPEWSTDPKFSILLGEEDGECDRMGEGMFHFPDQFPSGAIGPVWWHIETLHGFKEDKRWILHLHIHPSIRQLAMRCLEELLEMDPSIVQQYQTTKTKTEDTSSAMQCCMRINGENATYILQENLNPESLPGLGEKQLDWKSINTSRSTIDLENGSIVRVTLHPQRADVGNKPAGTAVAAVLVYQKPRPLSCSANRALSGWDLYCHPDDAFRIWITLAMKCVVIGIVEQSHLQLECEPPIPTFPRDFVDLEQSRHYWMSSSSSSTEVPPWLLVRKLYEGGVGRLPLQKKVSMPKVDWSRLTKLYDGNGADTFEDTGIETTSSDLVVVRGPFGQPFVGVLERCGKFVEQDDKDKLSRKVRRNRRRRTSPFHVKMAQPLNKSEIDSWQQNVQALQKNLSLPAVLVAHVRLVNNGTILAGDEIVVGEKVVGYATIGGFSSGRGLCHGMAVVGAALVLQSLTSLGTSRPGRVVRLLDGKTDLQLAGTIRRPSETSCYNVTMSFVLK